MSSSYYVNAFSKYTAGTSLFQNAEPTSFRCAKLAEEAATRAAAGAFPSTVPGLYNVNSPLYQNPFASGYGLGADAYGNPALHLLRPKHPGALRVTRQRRLRQGRRRRAARLSRANFRIYPWMRSSGRRSR